MTRKSVKSGQQRATQQTSSHAKIGSGIQRPHIFLTDPNVQEIKRALSPFWAWRIER